MKYLKYLVLLLIAIQFLNCNNNPKHAGPKVIPQNDTQKRLRVLMNKVYALYGEGKYDSVKIIARKGAAMSPGFYTHENMYFNLLMGTAFDNQRMLDSAAWYYRKSEATAIRAKMTEFIISSQTKLEDIYYNQGMPDSVNVYVNKMITEADTVKSKPLKMLVLAQLGKIYFNTNQPEKALKVDFQLLEYNQGFQVFHQCRGLILNNSQ